MKRRILALLGIILMGLIILSAPVLAESLQVVATFSILEDFVQQIGGDRLEVHSLIPRGADPHSWEPSPREARLVAQADLVVANGQGFDDWLVGMVENAARPDVPLLFAAQGLAVIEHHAHHGHESHNHSGDPHFWLSVANAMVYVEQITDALVELSPVNALYFTDRSKAYLDELEKLDQRMLVELGTIPQANRVIVAYHNAFSYLAERYGFEVVEFLVDNPQSEPSPRDMARLVEVLSEQNRPALFTEPQLSSGARYVQTLAREVGAHIYTLYSDSLSSDIPTYLEMMEYNLRTLVEALQ